MGLEMIHRRPRPSYKYFHNSLVLEYRKLTIMNILWLHFMTYTCVLKINMLNKNVQMQNFIL